MKLKELYNKQKKLEKEIEYEEKKQDVCAYGKEDLYYLIGLYSKLEKIEKQIEIEEAK